MKNLALSVPADETGTKVTSEQDNYTASAVDGQGNQLSVSDFLQKLATHGNITLNGFHPCDNQMPARSFSMPEQADAAVEWAERKNNKGFNVYFSVNPTINPIDKKPKKSDIKHVAAHHLDIDPIDVLPVKVAKKEFNAGHYLAGRQILKSNLQKYIDEYTPTLIIDSGNGYQLFWVRDEPISIEEGERINKALIQIIGGDTGTYNADRIMRLPGMKNYPTKTKLDKGYPKEPTDAVVLYYSPDGQLPDIDSDVIENSNSLNQSQKVAPTFNEDTSSLNEDEIIILDQRLDAFKAANGKFSKRLNGDTDGLKDTSRSGLDMSLCAILKNAGFSYSEMRHALIQCPHGAGSDKVAVGDERYFQRMWQNSDTKKSFLEVKNEIENLPLTNELADPEIWCKIIVEAGLSPTETEAIIDVLVTRKAGSKRALNAELKIYKARLQTRIKAHQLSDTRGERITIDYNPLDMNGLIQKSETAMLSVPGKYDLLHNGSFYTRVKVTSPTGFHAIDAKNRAAPDTAIFFIYDATSMLLRLEQSIQYRADSEKGIQEIPVPRELAQHMLLNPQVQTPVATGLVTHPIVYPDGTILINHGYDKSSSLYLHSGGTTFIDNADTVSSQAECQALIKGIHDKLFGEFEFGDGVDKSVAMAMMFTGVQRKTLDMAPGFVGTANIQGSGKTTAARMVYVTLTGTDMPVTSLSPDPRERKKEITTHLMEQMEMMCIDNEPDGSTLRSEGIAQIVTASEFKGRILGYSKNATVKTNVLLVYTGNNLEVDADLVRRLLVFRLEPTCERPEQRTFKHPDVVEYIRSIRVQVLADITTIIRSYLLSGDKVDLTPSGYTQWDETVRKPMVWAGYADPMDSCDKTRDNSPDIQGPIALLKALKDRYGSSEFTSSMISGAMSNIGSCTLAVSATQLSQVFDEYYPMHKRDARGMGSVLKKIIGRRINGNHLTKRSLHGISQYSVK